MAAAILRTPQDSSAQINSRDSPTHSASGPSNEDIEAVIQMATSATNGRSPAPKDTRTQLFVGNLPYRVRWQDLKDLFRKAGTVLRADVSLGPDNRSRGYGTVLLATAEDAGRAVDMFNGYNWQTRTLEVRPDRIAPDFDSPIPIAAPSAGYHSPSSLLAASGLSIPTHSPNLDEGLSLSRPGTASGNGSRNLFVGNLPFHCQWQDLKDLFRQAGTIIRADVALGPDGRSRGFGTVVFATDMDAERGLKMFNGYEFNGRPLKVHYDKFSPSQSSTVPTSPNPQMSFGMHPFGGGFAGAPTHIPMPFRYAEYAPSSGPSSPYDMYPPYVVMQHVTLQDKLQSPSLPEPQLSTSESYDYNPSTAANPPTPKLQSSIPQHPMTQQNHHHPGRIALPPSAMAFPPPHTLSPHAISPLHHPMSPMHHPHVLTMTPHGLPPITPSMPSFTFLPQPSPSMHGPPHQTNPPTPGYEGVPGPVPGHIMTAYAPFSPGLTMSPGAFWGRPGPGVNPYAAVGAPVHLQHTPYGMHPVAGSPVGYREDPGGYFPPVPPQDYFPFLPPSSGLSNEIMPDHYNGNRNGESSKDNTPGSDGVTAYQPSSEEEDDDDRIEIVTGSMEGFRMNGNHASPPQVQPKAKAPSRPPISRGNSTLEFDGSGHQHRITPASSTNGAGSLHRTGSDPVQTLLEKPQEYGTSSISSSGGEPQRRASFAEVVTEGSSPVQRKAIAMGLGIRPPGS